ncbi:hypothetical protein [Raoultella planticola]|uniref:hypothetical protein n=1 Tax=Raoultella planticola TaxID=575 RepID=UPI0013CF82E9|nr:hypothetical protein [Raoultella planticola]
MYYRNEVIRYLQSHNILALKLDHALAGVENAVADQIALTGAGAKRALYYASCFTDEYQDVCQRQKNEDGRFTLAVIHLFQHGDVVYEMFKVYFEEIFKYKTPDQLEHIKKMLMAVNIHIAASSLTNAGVALATATSVAVGLNLSLKMSKWAGRQLGTAASGIRLYGIVQKAADSAWRLHITCPTYYDALYVRELEMMFFLVEPLFEHAGAFSANRVSDAGIADIITKMIR